MNMTEIEPQVRKIVVGNRKMNGFAAETASFIRTLYPLLPADVRVLLCPSFVHLAEAVRLSAGLKAGSSSEAVLEIGAQDCAFSEKGAFTGDVSPVQLADLGVKTVILGHSERRLYHFEDNLLIGKKIRAARQAGAEVILCTGENEEIHQSKRTKDFIRRQLAESLSGHEALKESESFPPVIAYEPLWAIGSGKVPSVAEISDICLFIREFLQTIYGKACRPQILYGGSVNEETAAAVLSAEGVGGVLAGGASLHVKTFLPIIRAASFSV